MIIAKGAEATISKDDDKIIKDRTVKNYRLAELDKKIRTSRNRHEIKILNTLADNLPVPKVLESSKTSITMEFIEGPKLRDVLIKNPVNYGREIGQLLSKMHSLGIIHADVTTSNMIASDRIHLIDFGLSYFSNKIEDMAVDLHLLDRAVQAAHPESYDEFLKNVLGNYHHPKAQDVLKRLNEVELRGRYKKKSH